MPPIRPTVRIVVSHLGLGTMAIILMAGGSWAGQPSTPSPLSAVLPDFDSRRLGQIFASDATGGFDSAEAARLLYRLRRVDREDFEQRGGVVRRVGIVRVVRSDPLSRSLADTLEMPSVHRVVLDEIARDHFSSRGGRSGENHSAEIDSHDDDSGDGSPGNNLLGNSSPEDGKTPPPRRWMLVTDSLPPALQPGDRVVAWGVSHSRDAGDALVATRWRWNPRRVRSSGQRQLLGAGVDGRSLVRIQSFGRGSLTAGEREAFHAVLNAAHRIGQNHPGRPSDAPEVTDPSKLLTRSPAVGTSVSIEFEARMATRVVTERSIAGADVYYQIDGMIDLISTEVVLRSDDGNQIPVGSRVPVIVLSRQPPPGVGRDVQTPMNERLAVEGFFYRLISFDSDLTRNSGVRQLAPLVMAARVRSTAAASSEADRTRNKAAADHPAKIGMIAASVVGAGVSLTIASAWWWRRSDRSVRRRRRSPVESGWSP